MSTNPSLPRNVARFSDALAADPALLRQAEAPSQPRPSTSRIIQTWSEIPDVMTLSQQKIEWLAEGIIPRGSVTLIAGEPGSYKSWLALAFLHSLVTGSNFLGRTCAKARVLYLDRENPLAVVRGRLATLGIESLAESKIWGGWLHDAPPAIGDERLIPFARDLRPVIIFDSLIRFHKADENSATEMAVVMEDLRTLANHGATVVALHHKPKSEASRYRGSSDIAGGVDTAFSLARDRQAGIVKLECFKSRFIEEFSMTLRPDLTDLGDFVVTEAPKASAEREYRTLLEQEIQKKPGQTQGELLASTRIPRGKGRALLEQGNGEFWHIESGAHNAKLFFPLNQAGPIEIEV